MSSNDNDPSDPIAAAAAKASPAADVSFAAIGDGQNHQNQNQYGHGNAHGHGHAESSSQAESRSSSAKRSSHSISDRLARVADKATEKRSQGNETPHKAGNTAHNGTPHRSRKSGGFLLETVLGNGHLRRADTSAKKGKGSEQNGNVQLDHSRYTRSRASGESSQRSSPLSKDVSVEGGSNAGSSTGQNPIPGAMDPAQLVQMALNLSESRKRHASSTLPLPISPAGGGRRVVSALDSGYGTLQPASCSGRRSRLSDGMADTSSPYQRHGTLHDGPGDLGAMTSDNVMYSFSPATLSRAENARRYFELAAEHRRLLDYLPPLKLDATAPGNYTMQATSSPGSAHYQMTRVASYSNNKHRLGRAYNPLQALRNRRLRNISRRPLTAPPDTWQETDRIKRWIDRVEVASQDASYRPGNDQVRLPAFSGELESSPAIAGRPDIAHRHRRTDTATSVITRPENGWTIEPAELLADTYWTERDDNKTVIEDRHGNRIFPSRVRPSVEMPRKSKESERVFDLGTDRDRQNRVEEPEAEDKKRKKHKHTLPIPGRLRRNHSSRSSSVSTASSEEGRKPPPLRFGDDQGGDENVGPLERHMRSMIANEERGEMPSPELVSPDYWDSKHTPFPNYRASMDRGHRQSVAHGKLSVEMSQGHPRSRSTEGRLTSIDHGPSSMDELVSGSPASPVIPGFVQTMDSGISSRDAKRNSTSQQKSKGLKLPSLRSRSKERNNIERTDFAMNYGPQLSPVMSENTTFEFPPRSSLDSARPAPFRRLKTADSNASSLKRTDTTTTAADSSAKDSSTTSFGRRFLKGGRVGELVRNESSRFGDRFRSREGVNQEMSNVPSDMSDADDDMTFKRRHTGDEVDTDSQISPRASFERDRQRPRYFTSNLPSFKSPAGRGSRPAQTPLSEDSDPFEKLRPMPARKGHSKRPVPPLIQLPDDGNASEPEMSPDKSRNYLGISQCERRTSVSQNNLTRINTAETTSTVPARRVGDMPMSGLAHVDAKRHWSISDHGHPEKANKVTARDIARVRALLLASGIKAHEIHKIGSATRERPLPLIAKAYQSAGKEIQNVPRCQEHLVAARMLSQTLDESTQAFEKTLRRFQSDTAKKLSTRLEDLSHRAADQLTKLVHETSDEADAFNVELTTKLPQDVKRVDDAVEDMFRQRRRQFRLIINTGFKLLEWLLLGIMWWVWFVVVVFNTFRRILVGIIGVLKWLFSF
ncbi:uncharacterized protein MYCFIDRAFT_86386 [Pseudocercospora fijiensis CIRAD86]|uniref:Uncharacterized protein n=1 Tax=Pseudocercospora fijiensis (strain CIRAD86) TaxID=383855 RepID=N1QCL1_PSEFD|nr:uncharacterized protein MYCFIDRAFT_86386 [Pseudocercospora fijiensis CIRAD86]EME89487.1 hypothetical protein MYCFIDRAFT_86386 [Pseudocercospora fijiensis CIRAD86]